MLDLTAILKSITSNLPHITAQQKSWIDSQLKITLERHFSHMLITREEFDTQTKLLQATRQKLDTLEKKLALSEA